MLEEKKLDTKSPTTVILFFLIFAVLLSFFKPTIFFIVVYTLLIVFCLKGFTYIDPQEQLICLLYGKYVGSAKEEGLFWVNPFCKKIFISSRINNLVIENISFFDKCDTSFTCKVSANLQITDSVKAAFRVENLESFINSQIVSGVQSFFKNKVYTPQPPSLKCTQEDFKHLSEKSTDGLIAELQSLLEICGVSVLSVSVDRLDYSEQVKKSMLEKQAAFTDLETKKQYLQDYTLMLEEAVLEMQDAEMIDMSIETKTQIVKNLTLSLSDPYKEIKQNQVIDLPQK